MDNLQGTVDILIHSLLAINGYCEIPNLPTTDEVLDRCLKSQPWSTGDGVTQKHRFLSDMMESFHHEVLREKRFIVSGPILIATAIGLASTGAAAAASYYIAKSETEQVSIEQNTLRQIDSNNAISNNLKNNNISITWDAPLQARTISASFQHPPPGTPPFQQAVICTQQGISAILYQPRSSNLVPGHPHFCPEFFKRHHRPRGKRSSKNNSRRHICDHLHNSNQTKVQLV